MSPASSNTCFRKVAQTMNGNSYGYLESPGKFKVHSLVYSEFANVPDNNVDKIYTTWVNCEYIRNNLLPLDPNDTKAANPRAPDCKHSVVAEMQSTLKKHPEKFTTLNGGITLVCNDITVDSKGLLEIDLLLGDGIVNGGHTYYSICSSKDVIPSSALVKLEFIQISSNLTPDERKEAIRVIAVSRNKNRAISDESEMNFLGYFESWKDELEDFQNHISWKGGAVCICSQTGEIIDSPISAKELIKLLYWFEFKQHNYHPVYNNLRSGPKTPSKSQWEKWKNEVSISSDPIGWMKPLAIPILDLREWFYTNIVEKESGYFPGTTLVPIVGRGGGPGTVLKSRSKPFSEDNKFGEYLMKGGKDVKSILDQSVIVKELKALPEHIFGNFRSVLWRRNMKGGKVLVGWQYNPAQVWMKIRKEIIGALYYEWDSNGYNNLSFQRQCHSLFTIDFLEWVFVEDKNGNKVSLREITDEFTPPQIIYFDKKSWRRANKAENAQKYLNYTPKSCEFGDVSRGNNSFGYVEM